MYAILWNRTEPSRNIPKDAKTRNDHFYNGNRLSGRFVEGFLASCSFHYINMILKVSLLNYPTRDMQRRLRTVGAGSHGLLSSLWTKWLECIDHISSLLYSSYDYKCIIMLLLVATIARYLVKINHLAIDRNSYLFCKTYLLRSIWLKYIHLSFLCINLCSIYADFRWVFKYIQNFSYR